MADRSDKSTAAALVIGAGTEYAKTFLCFAKDMGFRVLGTSTLSADPARPLYDGWVDLPTIHDPSFLGRLNALVDDHDISVLFAGSGTIHDALTRNRSALPTTVTIASRDPRATQAEAAVQQFSWAEGLAPMLAQICTPHLPPDPAFIAANVRYASTVFGESQVTKLAVLSALAGASPTGDIVEIGVLMGRSAAILAIGARQYGKTCLLTIDPWDLDNALQSEDSAHLQKRTRALGADGLKEGFQLALLPIGCPVHVHLRKPSNQAIHDYRSRSAIKGDLGGEVTPAGKIALIHIDGNHDYKAVLEDCRLWLPHMAPGGWVVLDDYIWMHGDGPKRVGDALLSTGQFDQAFVCDKALFMRAPSDVSGLGISIAQALS